MHFVQHRQTLCIPNFGGHAHNREKHAVQIEVLERPSYLDPIEVESHHWDR